MSTFTRILKRQPVLFIQTFIVLGLIILVVHELQSHPSSPSTFPLTDNCVKSMIESDGFICEPDQLWNERKILHRIQYEFNMKKRYGGLFFVHNWEPDFHCAHARRIGRMGDGGKWVCDLFRLQNRPDCLVYSAGSSGDFSFEVEMKKYLPNCEIHTFDFGNYRCPSDVCIFHQFWLGDGQSPNISKTWPMIIKELGHDSRSIDIFKADIEGAEFNFFPTIFQAPKISHPRQILLEMHPPNVTAAHRFFKLLWGNNYVIFNKEPNLINKGELYEYAFLRLNSEFFK